MGHRRSRVSILERQRMMETVPSSSSSPAVSQPFPCFEMGHPMPINFITTASAASLRLTHLLHHNLRLAFLLRIKSSIRKFSRLCHVPRLTGLWCERAFQVKGVNFLKLSNDAVASACSSCLCFFNGEEIRKDSVNERRTHSETSRRISFNGRRWTSILLAANVLIYIAQTATQGKLLVLGAKINSLIDKGQFWRLVTSSFLHANIGHLMFNCYSLNSIGPAVEKISGPRRFLAVYFSSAIASSAMSYWFCKAPTVGASGAIFGLVGSFAVFVMRHRGMVRGGKEDLQHIAQVLVINMAIGLLSRGIDNWGHLGGLLGGAATSWLLGPAWKYDSLYNDGRKIVVDRAPIFYLVNWKRDPRHTR